MSVLAVVAHPDDEVLGVGATLAKHARGGDVVRVLILATGATSRGIDVDSYLLRAAAVKASLSMGTVVLFAEFLDQRLDTVPILEITKHVENAVAKYRPHTVYVHSAADLNRDHGIARETALVACRPVPGCSVKRILAFETVSSTEWGERAFHPTMFVDVTGGPFESKVRALRYYESEMRVNPHARSMPNVSALAFFRGASAGIKCAEAFEVVRWIES